MMQIGEVTAKFDISHRTLRFWEASGLIESIRTENGYRKYDEDNLRKIRQVSLLRKLDLPLADIEVIFRSGSLEVAVEVVKKQLRRVQTQTESLKKTSLLLEYLLDLLESRKGLNELFSSFEGSGSNPYRDLVRSLQSTPQKAGNSMNQDDILIRNDLRIVQLPRMIFAASRSEGENPEDAAWERIHLLTRKFHLDSLPGYRNLGYGYYRDDGSYVYTVWVTIPGDLILPPGYERVEFQGGLFACLPCSLMNIGERWNELSAQVTESEKYVSEEERPHGYCLEEVLNETAFFAPQAPLAERQLDLFLPIRKVETKVEAPLLRPEVVELPEVLLCGMTIDFPSPVKPGRLSIPWYRLAQSLYKIGPSLQSMMIRGSDTYAILSLSSPDLETLKIPRLYASVQMNAVPQAIPETLEMRTFSARKALMIPMGAIEEAGKKRINLQALFSQAAETVRKTGGEIDGTECLFREYRPDGSHVERVELYLYLK